MVIVQTPTRWRIDVVDESCTNALTQEDISEHVEWEEVARKVRLFRLYVA
jgi:hypothetical protein